MLGRLINPPGDWHLWQFGTAELCWTRISPK